MSNSTYTLKRDITSYVYPSHMKRPEGFAGSNFFEKWIPSWNKHLGHLSDKPNVLGIEIGTNRGDCAVFCAEKIVNGKNSVHYTIDIVEQECVRNNIDPYKNIKFILGRSSDVLIDRTIFKLQSADYIFIDGSHTAIDVLTDAIYSWHLLKKDGILIFDDYGWGIHTEDETVKPKPAIDAFLSVYTKKYEILQHGWQVFLRKIDADTADPLI